MNLEKLSHHVGGLGSRYSWGWCRTCRHSVQRTWLCERRDARRRSFPVCLPTPLAVTYSFCSEKDVVAIERAYEKAMIREVETVCCAIPHKDLYIQWDICTEMLTTVTEARPSWRRTPPARQCPSVASRPAARSWRICRFPGQSQHGRVPVSAGRPAAGVVPASCRVRHSPTR
jgi:hypothetical protein